MAEIPPRPTKAQVAGAANLLVPDVIADRLDVLFVGINPGLYSAAIGYHFGRPGNRFWPALHLGGFTPRVLSPWENDLLLGERLGITNVVERASARADELTADELLAGAAVLAEKIERHAPRVAALLGVTSYRIAFHRPKAAVGLQAETIGDTELWVLPNPSGLNAHYQLPDLGRLFAELRDHVRPPEKGRKAANHRGTEKYTG